MTAPDGPRSTGPGARDRILQAALGVIGKHGIGGLTNRLVARSAGVSLGSLTYHFATQQDLLRSCLQAFVDRELERIAGIAEAALRQPVDTLTAARQAEAVIESMVLGPHQVGAFDLYVHASRDPDLAEAARRCWDGYDRAAAEILQALGVDEPAEAARRVVALVAGSQLRRIATGRSTPGTLAAGIARLVGAEPGPRSTAGQRPGPVPMAWSGADGQPAGG